MSCKHCKHCKEPHLCPHCGVELVRIDKISCSWRECQNSECPEYVPEDNTGGEVRYSEEIYE